MSALSGASRGEATASGLTCLERGDATSIESLGEPMRATLGDDDMGVVEQSVNRRSCETLWKDRVESGRVEIARAGAGFSPGRAASAPIRGRWVVASSGSPRGSRPR